MGKLFFIWVAGIIFSVLDGEPVECNLYPNVRIDRCETSDVDTKVEACLYHLSQPILVMKTFTNRAFSSFQIEKAGKYEEIQRRKLRPSIHPKYRHQDYYSERFHEKVLRVKVNDLSFACGSPKDL